MIDAMSMQFFYQDNNSPSLEKKQQQNSISKQILGGLSYEMQHPSLSSKWPVHRLAGHLIHKKVT